MLYEEFVSRLPSKIEPPTTDEYRTIKWVYSNHPAFDSSLFSERDHKANIVLLYSLFGMRIICDMQETTKRAQEIKDEIWQKKQEIEELEREYKELAMR